MRIAPFGIIRLYQHLADSFDSEFALEANFGVEDVVSIAAEDRHPAVDPSPVVDIHREKHLHRR